VRKDAARNHEAILTAAIDVLGRAPQASMREIAEASGIGRTTLYRHFADRRALVSAIHAHVAGEADAISRAALGEHDDPVEVLAGLAADLAALGDRYRFLEHTAETRPAAERDADGEERLRRYVAFHQQAGGLRGDLDPQWVLEAFGALVTAAARAATGDGVDRLRMLRRTLRILLAP